MQNLTKAHLFLSLYSNNTFYRKTEKLLIIHNHIYQLVVKIQQATINL